MPTYISYLNKLEQSTNIGLFAALSRNKTNTVQRLNAKTVNHNKLKLRTGVSKKKIIPLKQLYSKHSDKIKNTEFIRANKRLKLFRKSMVTNEKLVDSLFHNPFNPLNLKSRILTDSENSFAEQPKSFVLRRQDQLDPLDLEQRGNGPTKSLNVPKLYFRERLSHSRRCSDYINSAFRKRFKAPL